MDGKISHGKADYRTGFVTARSSLKPEIAQPNQTGFRQGVFVGLGHNLGKWLLLGIY